jgi:hypothetical protein
MFSKYDIRRPICRQDVLEQIKRIQTAHENDNAVFQEEVSKIVEELKAIEATDEKFQQKLIKTLTKCDYDECISTLRDMIKELKYRGAGKPYQIFKSLSTIPEDNDSLPNGCFQLGQPFCITEKVDGTQIQIGLKTGHDTFQLLSHSGNSLLTKKNMTTLEDLEPKAKPGHTKLRDQEFQGGNLTQNFTPLIPIMWQLMADYKLDEAWFYYELTFKAGMKTPKGVPYDNSMMNRVYLFCMTYNIYDEAGNPIEVVKVGINPDTKPTFDKYGIPTVDILYAGDSFSIADFEKIMDIIHSNNKIEGVVFAQAECYMKLITHYYTEKVTKYPIQERHKDFAEMQEIYHKYLALRAKPKADKKGKKGFNMALVDEEFEKEVGHRDWTQMFTDFYKIPRKDNGNVVFDFVSKSELTQVIFKSLEEAEEFNELKSKQRGQIIKRIRDLMIKGKTEIREKFGIPSSKDAVKSE